MSELETLDDELHLIIKSARINKQDQQITYQNGNSRFDDQLGDQNEDVQLSNRGRNQGADAQAGNLGGSSWPRGESNNQNYDSQINDQDRMSYEAVQVLHVPLFFQLCRFGVVGAFAAAVHFYIVVTLVQSLSFEPLIANIYAFMISFQLSYFGHRRFTFNGTAALHTTAFPKLLTLQIFNFIANESLFYFFLSLHIPYQLALILVLSILPLFTFVISKFWIFQK